MMGSSSGTISSGSSGLQNSGSEEDLQQLMDQRKRKRMISNRESARRSRMRKQKHLDDLMAQVSQLRKENNQIITGMNVTTQHFLNVEAENSVLRAQVSELTHRLQSLNEIIDFMNNAAAATSATYLANNNHHEEPYAFPPSHPLLAPPPPPTTAAADCFMNNSWNWNHVYVNQPPLMASADMLHY